MAAWLEIIGVISMDIWLEYWVGIELIGYQKQYIINIWNMILLWVSSVGVIEQYKL
jgi:hypothetical protein